MAGYFLTETASTDQLKTILMTPPIRVMLVDDSDTVRSRLRQAIEGEPDLLVVAEASDAFAAREPFRELQPDVLVVDLVMPGMDGLSFLRKVMSFRPTPVILFTSEAAPTVNADALAAGAVAVVTKSTVLGDDTFAARVAEVITEIRRHAHSSVLPPGPPGADRIIAIGASTGGPDAISQILAALPGDLPPLLIAVHMPVGFTAGFAHRLTQPGRLQGVEARDGMPLTNGMAVIAPGDRHLRLAGRPGRWLTILDDGPPLRHHRPSIDRMFSSVARRAGKHALGILLTGMGDDGADGLVELRQAGAATVAQDEASSVVFGMPAEAIRRGGADRVLALDEMANHLVQWAHRTQKRDADAPAHL